MNCKRYLICVCLFFLPVGWAGGNILHAQNLQDEFDAFVASITGEFYTYLDSIDLAFANLLEEEWQEYIVDAGMEAPLYSRTQTTYKTDAAPSSVSIQEKVSDSSSFYGQPITLPAMQRPDISINRLEEKRIADAWRTLFRYDFTTLLLGVNRYCNAMALNDWGKYLLIHHVVNTRFPYGSSDEQTLLLVYLLIHVGLDVKMGFAGQGLILLLPVKEKLYNTPSITWGVTRYYLMNLQGGGVKEIVAPVHAYPGEVHPVSLVVNRPLAFEHDRQVIDLYATWPLCDLSVYFRSKPTRSFRVKMDAVFPKVLEGKTPIEQVAFLLDWVQQTVTHIPDIERHGQEQYYFPEESVFHRYADCEDLAVLLDWLIRTYTPCRTVTLVYKDHVAVAIDPPTGYEGPVLSYGGKSYVICDPSYKGAPMGEVVPANKSAMPTVESYH